jgi:hypothetical protein
MLHRALRKAEKGASEHRRSVRSLALQRYALLQFYVDLVLKHKVVPPEAMTWEFDEIIAGGKGPLCDDADLRTLRYAHQRSATVEDRRPLGLGDRAALYRLPFAILSYFLAYVDRIISARAYGFALGTFYWGYSLFEVAQSIVLIV